MLSLALTSATQAADILHRRSLGVLLPDEPRRAHRGLLRLHHRLREPLGGPPQRGLATSDQTASPEGEGGANEKADEDGADDAKECGQEAPHDVHGRGHYAQTPAAGGDHAQASAR